MSDNDTVHIATYLERPGYISMVRDARLRDLTFEEFGTQLRALTIGVRELVVNKIRDNEITFATDHPLVSPHIKLEVTMSFEIESEHGRYLRVRADWKKPEGEMP